MRIRPLSPSLLALALVVATSLCAADAVAQTPTEPAGAAPASAPVPIPPPPDVNDPMLAPVPPAAKSISTLEEALSLVKARSTDLRIAYLEVERAEAQSRVALAGLLPTINGNVIGTQNVIRTSSDSPNTVAIDPAPFLPAGSAPLPPGTRLLGLQGSSSSTSPVANFGTAALTLVQPIVNVRNVHSYFTAKEFEKVQRLSVEDVQRNIALNLSNALVAVVTAERVAELNRIGFRNALERLDLSTRKRALGAANGLDVVRAQQDVESARATLVTGDESLLRAREALGLALGLPQQVGVSKNLNIDGLEHAATVVCRAAQSLEERPDIAAARQRVYVAERSHDNVYLQFLPILNLQSAVNTTTLDTGPTPATTWNIQGVLTVPLWEGGARYGFLRDTQAQTEEARNSLEALRRNATIQLDQARRGVTVAEASRKVAADARALAAETDRLVRAGYTEGQGTSLELVVAAAALRQADVNLALADFNVVSARVLAILSLATCPF